MINKILTVFINMITLFLFALVIGYQVPNNQFKEELVAINTETKASENITNPFYEEENTTKPTLISNDNNWLWPTEKPYIITSYYEYRGNNFHNAIDIYSEYGSNIYSANSGIVVDSSLNCIAGNTYCNEGKGNYIVIKHNYNDYYTIYMHLSNITVNTNDTVEKGQIIGNIGNTGNVYPVPTIYDKTAGTHLHFGVFKGNPLNNGTSINPLNLYN